MDFSAVVERARQLHTEGKDCKSIDLVDGAQVIRAPRQDLTQEVYGRICNTDDPVPPKVLSSTPGRQTVFLFGPDSVSSIILQHNAYDCLCSLGFDKEYICHEVRMGDCISIVLISVLCTYMYNSMYASMYVFTYAKQPLLYVPCGR